MGTMNDISFKAGGITDYEKNYNFRNSKIYWSG